jgi:hypothetical protein
LLPGRTTRQGKRSTCRQQRRRPWTMPAEVIAGALALGGVGCLAAALEQWRRHNTVVGDARRLRCDSARAAQREDKQLIQQGKRAVAIVSNFRKDADRAVTALARDADPDAVLDRLGARRAAALAQLTALHDTTPIVASLDSRSYRRHRPAKGSDVSRFSAEVHAWMDEQIAAVTAHQAQARRQLQQIEALCLAGDPLSPMIEGMVLDVADAAADVVVAAVEATGYA